MQRLPSEVYDDDDSSVEGTILEVGSPEAASAQASEETSSSHPHRSSPQSSDRQKLHKQAATLIHRPFEDGPVLLHPDRRLRGPFASLTVQPTNGRIYDSAEWQDEERNVAAAAAAAKKKSCRGYPRRTGSDNDCIINTVDSDDDDDDDYSCSSDDARCREAMMMTTTTRDRQNNDDDDDDEMSDVIEWNRDCSPSSSPSKTQDADSQGHQRDNHLLGHHGNKGNQSDSYLPISFNDDRPSSSSSS